MIPHILCHWWKFALGVASTDVLSVSIQFLLDFVANKDLIFREHIWSSGADAMALTYLQHLYLTPLRLTPLNV